MPKNIFIINDNRDGITAVYHSRQEKFRKVTFYHFLIFYLDVHK